MGPRARKHDVAGAQRKDCRRKMRVMACILDCELPQGMNIVLILFLDSLYKVLVDTGIYLVILCIALQLMSIKQSGHLLSLNITAVVPTVKCSHYV